MGKRLQALLKDKVNEALAADLERQTLWAGRVQAIERELVRLKQDPPPKQDGTKTDAQIRAALKRATIWKGTILEGRTL